MEPRVDLTAMGVDSIEFLSGSPYELRRRFDGSLGLVLRLELAMLDVVARPPLEVSGATGRPLSSFP